LGREAFARCAKSLIVSGTPTEQQKDRVLGFTLELVADIPARRAVDYFVAAAFLPNGVHMQLVRLGPAVPGAP